MLDRARAVRLGGRALSVPSGLDLAQAASEAASAARDLGDDDRIGALRRPRSGDDGHGAHLRSGIGEGAASASTGRRRASTAGSRRPSNILHRHAQRASPRPTTRRCTGSKPDTIISERVCWARPAHAQGGSCCRRRAIHREADEPRPHGCDRLAHARGADARGADRGRDDRSAAARKAWSSRSARAAASSATASSISR